MEKVTSLLKGVFYLATEDGDQPRVRPFDSAVVYDNKIYFGTASNKKVYAQMIKNPKIEIYAMGDEGTVRLTGEVALEMSEEKTKEVFRLMGKYSDNDANPVLATFYIVRGNAEIGMKDGGTEVVELG